MNIKLIAEVESLIGDFLSNAISDAKLASEGYPHGSYIESLGKTDNDLIHLIDEINAKIGNNISLSESVLDIPSFNTCMYNLTKYLKSPEELKLKKKEQSRVTSSSGSELIEQIWMHDSHRYIQVIFDRKTFKTISVSEVVEKYNQSLKKIEFIQKVEKWEKYYYR